MATLVELQVIHAQPLETATTADGACGTACGSGCSSTTSGPSRNKGRTQLNEQPEVAVPFAKRRLNLDALPSQGTFITSIDMDLTVECNLRCTYCFKEKWNEHMEEQVAFDAMVWLIHASGPVRDLSVAFMGGEPLLRFKLIKKLVPFAKRRAAQHGKSIHFSATTNGTLVTDEVVDFWKTWGMGFHTSIDGTPAVQDRNRPTTGGRGSSRLVAAAAPKILAYHQRACARSTVVPETAGTIVDAYHYFRSLGYQEIAFVPGGQQHWDPESIQVYEDQFRKVGELVIEEFRQGNAVNVKGIDDSIIGHLRRERSSHPCGAGRGLVLVDIHGDVWPCHRWNKKSEAAWRIGSIYEQFNDAIRKPLDCTSFTDLLANDCNSCCARFICSGGCPAENLEQTGSIYRRHRNACELTRVWAQVGQWVHDTLHAERNPLFMRTYYENPNLCRRDD